MKTTQRKLELKSITAADIMQREVMTVRQETPVSELVELLVSQGIWGMPVVDDGGALVGVVSMTDVLRAQNGLPPNGGSPYYREYVAEGGVWKDLVPAGIMSQQRVFDIMSSEIVTAGADEPVTRLAERLLGYGIHRIIVTRDDQIVGLVTTLDILRAVVQSQGPG